MSGDPRLHPRGIKPSDTDGESLQTVDGVAVWGPPLAAGVETVTAGTYIKVDETDPANIIVTAMVPMTSKVDGKWELVFDTNGQIVYTEAP